MKKAGFRLLAVIFSFCLLLLLTGCPYVPGSSGNTPSPYPDPDILGSWGNINQDIKRPANWQRIVESQAEFQLDDALKFMSHNSRMYYEKNSGSVTWYKRDFGTFPAIDGSTVLLPLAAELGWQFLDLSDANVKSFFNFSTTHDAFLKLISQNTDPSDFSFDGVVSLLSFLRRTVKDGSFTTKYTDVHRFAKTPDIVIMTPPSLDELALADERGIELTIETICLDSFVFITHVDNPVDNLSIEQVKKIYSGEITNWEQVGGNNEEITAFQREQGSGSQTAMEETVMEGQEMMSAPEGWYIGGMGHLIRKFTAEYQNSSGSIGYTYKYYIDNLYKNPEIKVLKINGIEPSGNNVRNRQYPYVVPYNGVIRSADFKNSGGEFLRWLLSDEGQRCVAQAGYVAVAAISD